MMAPRLSSNWPLTSIHNTCNNARFVPTGTYRTTLHNNAIIWEAGSLIRSASGRESKTQPVYILSWAWAKLNLAERKSADQQMTNSEYAIRTTQYA